MLTSKMVEMQYAHRNSLNSTNKNLNKYLKLNKEDSFQSLLVA